MGIQADENPAEKIERLALRGLKRCNSTFGERRFVSVEHPYNSWMWWFTLVSQALEKDFEFAAGSNCCWGGDREKWYAVLNKCPAIQEELNRHCPGRSNLRRYDVTYNSDGSLHFATEEEAEYKREWCEAYARGLKRHLERLGWIDQMHVQGRCVKISKELLKSTTRLSDPETSRAVAMEVAQLEKDMRRGMEAAHLKEMVRQSNIRGAEVRLLLGESDLEVPYPAYRWLWREVLSYAWRAERRINEGEIGAFIVMLRRRCKDPKKHELRYLAVVDSMVSRPSRALNRLLKQTGALVLASDQYPLVTWTISQGNFADGASRRRRAK